jgi:hypothetical protein
MDTNLNACSPSAKFSTPSGLNAPKKEKQIGGHAQPQRSFSFSTPRGAEREGATPSNTGRKQHRESRQSAHSNIISRVLYALMRTKQRRGIVGSDLVWK